MIEEWNTGQRTAHAYLSAGLPLPDEPWSHSYELLRRRSAWDVIASTFQHPVARQVMAWMAFATMQPPQRPGTGALPAAIMAGRLAYGWANTDRRVWRVAERPRGPHHRPRRHRRDVGVGAVVPRRGRALRRGAHR